MRYLFAGTTGDYTADTAGNLLPALPLIVATAPNVGAVITDITTGDLGTVSDGVVTSSPEGAFSFNGPDGHDGDLYVRAEGGGTWRRLFGPSAGTVRTRIESEAAVTYVAQPNLVDRLPARWYVAHRGGASRYGEHSIESYRAALAAGFVPEQDLSALADGTLVPLHDSTVDRTMTGGAGAVTGFTLPQWKALRIKGARPGAPLAIPPTWDEVLAELGGRCVLLPEIKPGTPTQAVIDSITSRSLGRSVIVQSFTLDDVTAAAAAGVAGMYLSDVVTDFAAVRAAGVEFLGVSVSAPSRAAYIANAVGAGLVVAVYGVTNIATATAVLAEGAAGVFADDPWWISGQYLTRDGDPFREQVPWPHLVTTGTAAAAAFKSPNEFGRSYASAIDAVVTGQEWAGTRPGGNVRIDATLRFTGPASSEDRWAGIAYGVWPSETTFTDAQTAGQNAYHAIIRRNGTLNLYKNTAAVGTTALGTFAGTAAAAAGKEGSVRVRLEINATGVTWTNLTTGQQVTSTDTALRTPGRLALSFNGADCMVSDVRVTDL